MLFRSRNKPTDRKRGSTQATSAQVPAASKIPGARRNIYVNCSLSAMEMDHDGEPKVKYVRNKVRTTSKSFIYLFCSHVFDSLIPLIEYTIFTFIPKNLYEQFRR